MKMFCTRVLLLVWFAAGGALGVCESEEAEVNGCINTKPNTGCAGCVIATFNGLTSSLCQSIEDEMCNAITTACDCSPCENVIEGKLLHSCTSSFLLIDSNVFLFSSLDRLLFLYSQCGVELHHRLQLASASHRCSSSHQCSSS